jgi:DNA-binding HxlR family transcriptional regulator
MSYAAFRKTHPLNECPLNAAIASIGGRWKIKIISWLAESPHHYAGLCERLPDISRKVLTQQLRDLTCDGIVRRETTGAAPSPVIYSLTDHGLALLPALESVKAWGRELAALYARDLAGELPNHPALT